MKLGFIRSNYANERRISLLPQHIKDFENKLLIEKDYGLPLGIPDDNYEEKGCEILSREEIFQQSDAIFSLKVLQPEDYDLIQEGQMTIGWLAPEGTDRSFWEEQGIKKNLIGVDLNNTDPKLFYHDKKISIPWIPRDFVYRNSFTAGLSATMNALMNFGLIPSDNQKIAVLGSGNVAQGAMHNLSKYTSNIRMFYRTTLDEFIERIAEYDIIVNGINIGADDDHIVTVADQKRMKPGALIIDAAAQKDGTIEGIDYTTLGQPIREKNGKYYYCVDNTPSVYYRTASEDISAAFSRWVYKEDIGKLFELAKEIM